MQKYDSFFAHRISQAMYFVQLRHNLATLHYRNISNMAAR